MLWALHHGGLDNVKGLDEVPHLAASGRTSFTADAEIPKGFYRAAGFRVCGERVVRVDILERLADLIRPAIAYRPGVSAGEPPPGTADAEGFVVTVAMTSLTGCSGEAFSSILKSLNYVPAQRPSPAITAPLIPAAATEPLKSDAGTQILELGPSPESISLEAVIDAVGMEPSQAVEAMGESQDAVKEELGVQVEMIEIWTQQRPAHAPARRPAASHRPRAPQSVSGAASTEGQRGSRHDSKQSSEGARPHRKDKSAFEKRLPRGAENRTPQGGKAFTASPERRDRPPDPNSPFAKLAALKAELEKKGTS